MTDRYRTTIPVEVDDPVLDTFLAFLADDVGRNPDRLAALDEGLARRLRTLSGLIDVDLDAPLSADDE